MDATETGSRSNFFAFVTAWTAIELAERQEEPDANLASFAAQLEWQDIELREFEAAELALRAAIDDADAVDNVGGLFERGLERGLERGMADPQRYNLESSG